jgi:hypothetical protein
MSNHKSARPAVWKVRREEYLRASGRLDDLVKEGYICGNSEGSWSVIAGGRTGRLQVRSQEIRPFL